MLKHVEISYHLLLENQAGHIKHKNESFFIINIQSLKAISRLTDNS